MGELLKELADKEKFPVLVLDEKCRKEEEERLSKEKLDATPNGQEAIAFREKVVVAFLDRVMKKVAKGLFASLRQAKLDYLEPKKKEGLRDHEIEEILRRVA